ncbi:sugar transferase [Devosia sp. Naph2]|uniref:sugar transferase n=1 Tax=Devosia polycyclovorans TaxID=3345148 RepID=UPI0035CF958B
MLKRGFDILSAASVLIVSSPVWLLIAILIKAHDGGPVFYRQIRTGLVGRTFGILKFRSMVQNADKIGGYSTADNDSRITPIGRFIRRTSLDELPQLFNVLRGDMSVVGPRPDVPEQRSLYSAEEFDKRNRVRPGITGLAQATMRSTATPEERKRLDLEYVDQASFLLDMKILALTVRQVLTKGGN